MTDHAAITDEELAEVERRSDLFVDSLIRRTVADLRASRAEVARLQKEIICLQAENEQLEKWVPSGW